MLKEIKLNYFQPHKQSELPLHEGLNVITGSSDAGKSSIIRALRWVYENRPLGDSIKNWNYSEKETSVSIKTFEDYVISKTRNGTNSYSLGKKEFDVTKTEVPQEVTDTLNLSDCNIQLQHESYFLLDESPGERAKIINELSGLDIIDKIFKNLNSKILSTKRDISSEESNIKSLTEDIEKLTYLDAVDVTLSSIESLLIKSKELWENISSVSGYIGVIQLIREGIKKTEKLRSLEKPARELLGKIEDYQESDRKLNEVKSIVHNIKKIRELIQIDQEWLEIEKPTIDLLKKIEESKSLSIKINAINSLVENIHNIGKERGKKENLLASLNEKYEAFVKKNKLCPLCGGKLNASISNR